jgi:hypothetical protein
MDSASLVDWLAVGRSVWAVVVILRYGRGPRGARCARGHVTRDADHREPIGAAEHRTGARPWSAASWRPEPGAPRSADVASPN